jgi:hypothetical protein
MGITAESRFKIRRGTQDEILSGSMLYWEIAIATDTKHVFFFDGVAKQVIGKVIIDDMSHRPIAGVSGRLFHATDTGELFIDDGSSWKTFTVKTEVKRAPIFMMMGA